MPDPDDGVVVLGGGAGATASGTMGSLMVDAAGGGVCATGAIAATGLSGRWPTSIPVTARPRRPRMPTASMTRGTGLACSVCRATPSGSATRLNG